MQAPDHRSGDPLADRRADYAAGLVEDGEPAAAADLMRHALDLAPEWAAGWNTLGTYLEKAGESVKAMEAFRRAASLDPADGLGARAKLAALGAGSVPDTLPPAFVRGLFDQYADRFERQLRDRLGYRAPEHLMAAIRDAGGGNGRFGDMLDLGCGTGLMGTLLRPLGRRLAGLDLSPCMLAQARAKGVYDELHEADILGFDAAEASLDLVVAADVLNYLGDLAPVFARVARWLRPGGFFAFTVEAHNGDEVFVLRETMRYAHSGKAVRALLTGAGLSLPVERQAALRRDRGEAVEGEIFVTRKDGGGASVRDLLFLHDGEKVAAAGWGRRANDAGR